MIRVSYNLQAHRFADNCLASCSYNDGVVQAVTFAYLIFTDEFLARLCWMQFWLHVTTYTNDIPTSTVQSACLSMRLGNQSCVCVLFKMSIMQFGLMQASKFSLLNVYYVCRDSYITSDIRTIAAGPLFYPLSLNRCQETEFDNEYLQRYKTSPPAARYNESASSGVADFLRDRKLSQTGLTFNLSFLCIEISQSHICSVVYACIATIIVYTALKSTKCCAQLCCNIYIPTQYHQSLVLLSPS